jgi:uncharacterized protein YqcC (DUF446 family)
LQNTFTKIIKNPMVMMNAITDKVTELKIEMKRVGLWRKKVPYWVNEFTQSNIKTEQDFAEWLQFVYLPNMLQLENRSSMGAEKYIVQQAVEFFGTDVQKGTLLQLLIELDGLL